MALCGADTNVAVLQGCCWGFTVLDMGLRASVELVCTHHEVPCPDQDPLCQYLNGSYSRATQASRPKAEPMLYVRCGAKCYTPLGQPCSIRSEYRIVPQSLEWALETWSLLLRSRGTGFRVKVLLAQVTSQGVLRVPGATLATCQGTL